MKKYLNFILTVITIAMLVLLTFSKLNETANWVDLTKYEAIIKNIGEYGPMVLLCGFAFGNLVGKIASKIFFIIIVILLIVFTIAMFAPSIVSSIFGGAEAVIGLMRY